jgi:hypothetical protein
MDPMLFVTDPIPSMEAIQPHMMANIPPHGEESVYHNLKPQAGATVSSDKVLITPFDQV